MLLADAQVMMLKYRSWPSNCEAHSIARTYLMHEIQQHLLDSHHCLPFHQNS